MQKLSIYSTELGDVFGDEDPKHFLEVIQCAIHTFPTHYVEVVLADDISQAIKFLCHGVAPVSVS